MREVEKPTISPFGHVMGYDSWMRVLNGNPKNICPFTKQVGLIEVCEIEIESKTTCEINV